MAKHMIQKSAYRRIGTSTFMPHGRHVMPLHREITEQRNKLFVAYPGRRHKIRGHTDSGAGNNGGNDGFAGIRNDR